MILLYQKIIDLKFVSQIFVNPYLNNIVTTQTLMDTRKNT